MSKTVHILGFSEALDLDSEYLQQLTLFLSSL